MSAVATEIEFDEEKHEYRVANIVYPSVTTVLAGVGLIDTSWFDERSAQRGRVAHKVTEIHDRGEEHLYKWDELDRRAIPYLEAWKSFKRETGFEATEIEQKVFNRDYGYAGCLDRLGKLRDGSLAIVDIKSGIAARATALQLAAYLNCLDEPRRYTRFAVTISDDGCFNCKEYAIADYRRDRDRFLMALNVFRVKEEYGL